LAESVSFTPLAGGVPALKGQTLKRAVCHGGVLAMNTSSTLWLFRGPEGAPIGDYVQRDFPLFTISSDGRFLARQTHERRVEIRDIQAGNRLVLATRKAKTHDSFAIYVDGESIRAQVDKFRHEIRWGGARLALHSTTVETWRFSDLFPGPVRWTEDMIDKLSSWLTGVGYDRTRFFQVRRLGLVVAADSHGQLVVFDLSGKLICHFCIFRKELAAWMPDGTRYGPASITGGPSTPGALDKIGRALEAAK
jgi:hypothetical protein